MKRIISHNNQVVPHSCAWWRNRPSIRRSAGSGMVLDLYVNCTAHKLWPMLLKLPVPCVVVLLFLGFSGCNGIRVQPQRVSATAVIAGLDGLSQPSSQTFSLSHNVGEPDTERLSFRRILINQVRDFDITVTRTGIPIEETFILLNISSPGFAPGSTAPQPTVVAEEPTYIPDHVGRMVSISVDTPRIDSPLTSSRHDVFQTRQRTGYTLFARWHKDDPCMPFSDAAAPIDVSRFATVVFDALSGAVVAADNSSNLFRLGGPLNNGNFELFFVPHTQHSTRIDFGTPWNGFTLIFKASITAGAVSADVYVPLSLLFIRTPGVAGGQTLDARLDLLDLGSSSDDRKRITVAAEGLFETATATAIRQKVLDAVDDLPQSRRDAVQTAVGLFAAVLNSLRPNQGQSSLKETVRVVLFPGTATDQPRNQILPANVGLRPRLCILN